MGDIKGRIDKPELVFSYLEHDTDGKNGIADYSSVAGDFFYQPAEQYDVAINRMIVSLEDGAGNFNSGGYGVSPTPLTNGIHVEKQDINGNTLVDLDSGVPIKMNGQWAQVCHDVVVHDFGAGNGWMTVRWTFGHSGQPLVLKGEQQEKFVITLNDDFDHLISHRFQIQGYRQLAGTAPSA